MKIFIGSDHNGFHIKNSLVSYLKSAGYDIVDDGDTSFTPDDDYPLFAQKVVADMKNNDLEQSRGILLCGSGQGMCIAANRYMGIRACLGYDIASIKAARNDDDSNILCLPANTIDKSEVNMLVETWLNTPFAAAPRFIRRNREIDELSAHQI
jgi:ribose 5-phosphate isomerase B